MSANHRIIVVLMCCVLHFAAHAQGSHWQYDAYAYQYDMTVYYSLEYEFEDVTDLSSFEVAALCGEECRGIGEVQTVSKSDGSSVSYGYMRIRSNQAKGEEISFMAYNKMLDAESHVNETLTFTDDALAGMPSSPVKLTFRDERPVTVTVIDCSREYYDANPVFEFTVDGPDLKGSPEIVCEATEASPVGDYPIVITKGSVTNYNVTLVGGKLTVTKAPLTISGGKYTIVQGDELPVFVPVYSGFKNDETEEVMTKPPTLTTEATSASAPGVYDIIVADAEAPNYEIAYVNGSLTILPPDMMKGDVNIDGVVDILDVVATINIMAGKTGFYSLEAADANSDGEVNIVDVTTIINIIAQKY